MRRTLTFVFVSALLAVVALGGGFFYVQAKAREPGANAHAVRLLIEPGMGVNAISNRLWQTGVTRYPRVFKVWARMINVHTRLRAGEFDVPANASIAQVLELLVSGETVVRKLTVAEGLSVAEALLLVQDAEGLAGSITVVPDEGQILPETYHYAWGDARDGVIRRMMDDMTAQVMSLWSQRPGDFPLQSPLDVVTLASIVEKETGVDEERPRIAAVFLNRLRKGMRLQSDPTVVYALTNGIGALGRALTRDDLKIESPFNTYQVDGLPPTPIANPGRDSLRAVIFPADADDLYFVADGTGGHVFAATLSEHNKNVRAWRRIKRGLGGE
ncbi:MAG: endolytic transglycosylase MltG [Alphaproteobacteria bacterium]|nr:endolytic transglycosylase MltG [Alphaproteobacteria bacterium]